MNAAALPGRRQSLLVLDLLFWTAVVVSIVHYTDNFFAYDRFPQASSGPSPSRTVVGVAWFVFTSAGLIGYRLYRQGLIRRASAFLAFYSISGIIGIGHYTASGMTDAVWWRQAHVIADILLGLAVFGFAVWTARRADRGAPAQKVA